MNYLRILPWIFIAGIIFAVLSYSANKYHGKDRTTMQLLQDFIGGCVFIGLLSAIIPDIFPDIRGFVAVPTALSSLSLGETTKMLGGAISSVAGATRSVTDDIDLQVGPLP
jgi:hypothetical protein